MRRLCFKNYTTPATETTHFCQLPTKEDELHAYIPGNTRWARFKRKWKRMCLVSVNNPCTKTFLKSKACIIEEQRRQLFYHYYVIHPFSDFRAFWELFMSVILFVDIIVTAIHIFTFTYVQNLMIVKLIFNLIGVIDIILTFFTGTYNAQTVNICLQEKEIISLQLTLFTHICSTVYAFCYICRNYLKGYFIMDLIGSFPLYVLIYRYFHHIKTYLALSCLKIFRFPSLLKYIMRTGASLELECSTRFKCLYFTIIGTVILIWASSIKVFFFLYLKQQPSVDIVIESDKNSYKIYIISLYQTTYQLMLCGYGLFKNFAPIEMAFTMVLLTGGLVIKVYMTALILVMTKNTNSSTAKYIQMLQQLHAYIRYKELPDAMKRRIITYYDFRFQKRFYKEKEILTIISTQLKQEIVLHSCRRLVENVTFFKSLPPHVLIRIVTCLRSEIYLKDDVIVQHHTEGDSMYFIASGTVAIFTSTGKEICHLEDGSHFGEVALVMDNELRIASVVAIEICELYVLERKDFRRAIEPFPELLKNMRSLALDRVRRTNTIARIGKISSLSAKN